MSFKHDKWPQLSIKGINKIVENDCPKIWRPESRDRSLEYGAVWGFGTAWKTVAEIWIMAVAVESAALLKETQL